MSFRLSYLDEFNDLQRQEISVTLTKVTKAMTEQTNDSLQNLEPVPNLLPADKGLRFANFLIDYIVFATINYLITDIFESFTNIRDLTIDDDAFLVLTLYGALISIGAFILFYTTIEYYTRGRTLGKLATNTVAVRKDGGQINFKDALLRSLCRLIPFEAIAALFVEPWHDSITNTTVVKKT